jgi:hypothetical protein
MDGILHINITTIAKIEGWRYAYTIQTDKKTESEREIVM